MGDEEELAPAAGDADPAGGDFASSLELDDARVFGGFGVPLNTNGSENEETSDGDDGTAGPGWFTPGHPAPIMRY